MTKTPPVLPLTQAQADVLCAFEGYGRLTAPVWFLGMEEAGSDPQLLHTRAAWDEVVRDLWEAHASLGLTQFHEAGVRPVVLQQTWRPMCVLMVLGEAPNLYVPFPKEFSNLTRAEKRPFRQHRNRLLLELRRYQSTRLGRAGDQGETFLCELLPIPKPTANGYPFQKLLPMWDSHAHYQEVVGLERKTLLSGRIAKHRPQVVVGYGKAFWNEYRDLFPNTPFAVATEEQRALLPAWFPDGVVPDEEHSDILFGLFEDRTLVVLVHHLTRVNDYARLAQLASLIRSHRQRVADV